MADIDIVPKQRSYTWLWILLALVILAVVWWALAGGTDQPAELGPGTQLTPQYEIVPAASTVRAT